jgi:hypothetical protein
MDPQLSSPDEKIEHIHRTIDSIVVLDTLQKRNPHSRDDDVLFEPEEHKYEVKQDSHPYMSVTTWNSSNFSNFETDEIITKMMASKRWKPGHKYWGLTVDRIKDMWRITRDTAGSLGECLHKLIEKFMNRPTGVTVNHKLLLYASMLDDPFEAKVADECGIRTEWNYFIQYIVDNPEMVPFRTEWRIYHEELKLCGTMDMVYLNPDGTLSIFDWKRSKEMKQFEPIANFRTFCTTPGLEHLPDLNYWHYVLQLNMYKMILEQRYDKVVSAMCLVRLHANSEKGYEIFVLPTITEEIKSLISRRLFQLKEVLPSSPLSHF